MKGEDVAVLKRYLTTNGYDIGRFGIDGVYGRSTKEAVKELLEKYIGSYEKEDYYRWATILKTTKCCSVSKFFLIIHWAYTNTRQWVR